MPRTIFTFLTLHPNYFLGGLSCVEKRSSAPLELPQGRWDPSCGSSLGAHSNRPLQPSSPPHLDSVISSQQQCCPPVALRTTTEGSAQEGPATQSSSAALGDVPAAGLPKALPSLQGRVCLSVCLTTPSCVRASQTVQNECLRPWETV